MATLEPYACSTRTTYFTFKGHINRFPREPP
jgi:hypothetical protein